MLPSRINYYQYLSSLPPDSRQPYLQKILTTPQSQSDFHMYESSYENQTFIECNGIKHHIYYEEPKGKPRGLFFLMHGMDGHAGTSGYLGKFIAHRNQMVVVALDFRNFGKTVVEGERKGYVGSVMTLLQDAEVVCKMMVEKYRVQRVFLGGLSMGGAIAFRMAIRQHLPYTGIILFAPALRQNHCASPYLKKLAQFLGYLLPTLQLSNTGGSSFSVKHKSCAFQLDPLNYSGKVIPGSVRQVLLFQEECSKMFKELKTPYLMIMGGNDKVVDPFLVVDLEREAGTEDRMTFVYKEMWHSVWRGEEMGDIVNIVEHWIEERTK